MTDREDSPPRTIRTKALHGSIRDISGASVAQALAGNGGSILESEPDIMNVAKTLHEKLTTEYNVRVHQLRIRLRTLHPGDMEDYHSVVRDEFDDVVHKLLRDTEVACERVRSMKGKDFSFFIGYCTLTGLFQLALVLAESMKPPVSFDIPKFQDIYMEYLSRGDVFKIDRESLLKISQEVASAVIDSDDSDSDSYLRSLPLLPARLASRAARKAFPPRYEHSLPDPPKKARVDPPVPKAASPPKKPMMDTVVRSISPPVRKSQAPAGGPPVSPDSPATPVRQSPRLNAPSKAATLQEPSLLKQAVETMKKVSAPRATPPPPGSPKHITQRFADFANLIAYIHEPLDPSIPTAIKEAKDLKKILTSELESIERKQRDGEFFTQQ